MAERNWAQGLQALGAGLQGQLPQYMAGQARQQEAQALQDEQRRKQLLTLNRTALVDLASGRRGQAEATIQQALDMVPESSRQPVLGVLQRIQAGDEQGALEELKYLDDRAVQIGELEPIGGGTKIHSVKGGQAIIERGGNISATPIQGYDPELAGPGDARGQFAGNETFVDESGNYFIATRVADPNTRQTKVSLAPVGHNQQQQGALKPVNTLGLTAEQLVSQKGNEAAATASGKGIAERAQETMQLGIDAARSMPLIRRSKELLDEVKTGGWNTAAMKLKQWTGMTSGNEAELTANLSRAVLSQLRSTFGAQFTEREGAKLETIEAGIGKSTRGNIRILEQLERMNRQKVEQALRAAESVKDYRTAAEIQDYMEMDMGDEQISSLFNPAQDEDLPTAPDAPQAPPSGGIRILRIREN